MTEIESLPDRIHSIARWLAQSVTMATGHPEDPPEPASTWDDELDVTAETLHEIAEEVCAALAALREQGEVVAWIKRGIADDGAFAALDCDPALLLTYPDGTPLYAYRAGAESLK